MQEQGDYEAVNNLLDIFGMQSQTLDPAALDAFRFHFIAGHGGYPLVGTPDQIVNEMGKLVRIGIDGVLVSWVNYQREVPQWVESVMPLMVQAGLREG